MEQRMMLWLYAISALYTAGVVLRRRAAFERRFLVVLLAIAAVSAAGLVSDGATTLPFWLATAGFGLFLLAPGLLVRQGRRSAERGRFRRAARLVRTAFLLFPATGLKSEEELYRRIHESGGAMNPVAVAVRTRLHTAAGPSAVISAPATVAILLFVVLAHLGVEAVGDSRSIVTLVELGANEARLVSEGQIYRLFTAMFLHFGLFHLACNALALWVLGPWVEPEMGWARTLVVFLLAGLLGNLASYQAYLGQDVVGAGASGGAMGLVGCATALLMKRPGTPESTRRLPALLLVIGATLLIGVMEPGIDNAAHIGGLTAGFVLGLIFTRISRLPDAAVRAAALVLLLASAGSVVWMLVDRPRWSAMDEVEFAGVVLSRPSTSTIAERGGALEIEWRPFGGARVRVEETRGDPKALALSELAKHPDLRAVPVERVEEPLAGWVARAMVTSPDGEEAFEIYVLESPPGGPAAVLTFEYHPGDALLRERLVGRTVQSLRFR